MPDHQTPIVRSTLPFAENVRKIGADERFQWLAAGWRDFRASGIVSLLHGLVFVFAGILLAAGLLAVGLTHLLGPMIVGFMLVGAALTVGCYAISRDLAARRQPSFIGAASSWRANAGPILGLGLLLVLFLVV